MKAFRRLLNASVLNAMIIYGHNMGKKIDQLAFRVNSVEALSEQFADTERKVAGRQAAENIIPLLRERHFIQKVPPSGKKINTAEEVRSMHKSRPEERHKVLLSTV
jgi:hypothetical protein